MNNNKYNLRQLRGAFAAGQKSAPKASICSRTTGDELKSWAIVELWDLAIKYGPIESFTRDGPGAEQTRTIILTIHSLNNYQLVEDVFDRLGEMVSATYGEFIGGLVLWALENRISEIVPAWTI